MILTCRTHKEWQMLVTGDDYEHHGGIKCERRSNPGLEITWGPNFFGAVGRINMEGGRITVREELVPYLVHGLRRMIDGSDVLDTQHAANLIRTDPGVKISCVEGKNRMDALVGNAAILWNLAARNPRNLWANGRSLADMFGDADAMNVIMDKMRNNGIDPIHLAPGGFVPPGSAKYRNGIIVLEESGAYSKDGKHLMYIAQMRGREEATIVKIDAYIAKRMVGDILRQFGTVASIMPIGTAPHPHETQKTERSKSRT